jgi:hypothetical protein
MIAKRNFKTGSRAVALKRRERRAFGRDIALRCPRPRSSGRNESPATHEFSRFVAPLNVHPPQYCYGGRAARTAQRTVPTTTQMT